MAVTAPFVRTAILKENIQALKAKMAAIRLKARCVRTPGMMDLLIRKRSNPHRTGCFTMNCMCEICRRGFDKSSFGPPSSRPYMLCCGHKFCVDCLYYDMDWQFSVGAPRCHVCKCDYTRDDKREIYLRTHCWTCDALKSGYHGRLCKDCFIAEQK